MTGIVAGWLLRPETLALASITLLAVWALRPIAEYLDREVPLEGEMDFTVTVGKSSDML